MIWEDYNDLNWSKHYHAAKQYYKEHGNLEVPSRYVNADGVSLGRWISSVRSWYNSGAHKKYLQNDRVKQLEDIGMIWNAMDNSWEQNFKLAEQYYREHRNLDVPSNYKTKDGTHLGSWIGRQKQLHRTNSLSNDQIKKLNSIGMDWMDRVDRIWEKGFL